MRGVDEETGGLAETVNFVKHVINIRYHFSSLTSTSFFYSA